MNVTKRNTLRLRALARLISQSRLNSGEALAAGRTGEAAAWLDVALLLQSMASYVRNTGTWFRQPSLWDPPEELRDDKGARLS
jgi:hypothetical protein